MHIYIYIIYTIAFISLYHIKHTLKGEKWQPLSVVLFFLGGPPGGNKKTPTTTTPTTSNAPSCTWLTSSVPHSTML